MNKMIMMRCKMMISKLSLIIFNKSKTKMILKLTVLRKNVFKSNKRRIIKLCNKLNKKLISRILLILPNFVSKQVSLAMKLSV